MNVAARLSNKTQVIRQGASEISQKATLIAFGDRLGSTVFLTSLVFIITTWKVSFLINDNYTVANAMVAVADGHLDVRTAQYGPHLETPGMVVSDGLVYGRNYGHVFYALPFLWVIEAISAVSAPRIAVAALWSLLVVALGIQVGAVLGREDVVTGASVVALVLFAGNVAFATPLDPYWFPMMALQLSSMVAGAFTAVVLYRLLSHAYSKRVGVFASLAVVLATPVGLWAAIPKRHAIVTFLVVATMYGLYRSRTVSTERSARRHRALAYAWVGLMTWIHPMEAFLVFIALVVVDVPTARSNDLGTLLTVGAAFAVSLVPFMVTNVLISGNPFVPPRMLDAYSSSPGGAAEAVHTTAGGAVTAVSMLVGYLRRGVELVLSAPDTVVDVFLRSGYIEGVTSRDANEAINLTMLESAPLLGALFAVPIVVGRAIRRTELTVRPLTVDRIRTVRDDIDPLRIVDAFVVVCTIGFLLVYLPRLPIHAQVTVRYLLPLFAFGVYGVARLSVVRGVLARAPWTMVFTAAAVVLVGGQFVFVWLHVTDAAVGETFQFNALLGLFAGVVFGAWTVGATWTDTRSARMDTAGALALGLAVGVGAMLLVLIGVDYFGSAGDFALGLFRRLSAVLETA